MDELVKVFSPDIVKFGLLHHCQEGSLQLTPPAKGATNGAYNKALIELGMQTLQANLWRRWVFGWLFGDLEQPMQELSSKALTDHQWFALHRWQFGPDGIARDAWKREVWQVYWRMRLCYDLLTIDHALKLRQAVLMTTPVNQAHSIELTPGELVDTALQKGGVLVYVESAPNAG